MIHKCFWTDDEKNTRIYNKTARLIKQLSALLAFVGVIVGLCFLANSAYLGIVTIIVSILMYIFFKGFGEIIQLLEDIKNK